MSKHGSLLLKYLFFVLALVAMYQYAGLFEVLNKRPQSVHQWAQVDRASVARNYAEESMDFSKPRTNHTNEGEGVVGLEFPLINYMAAILYKIFGFNELWYRLLMMLIVTAGLVATFGVANRFLSSPLIAGIATLLFASSPVLHFYTANFIPDAASLGFILLAWLFFFKYKDERGPANILLFILFASLAALVKITSLISVTAMAGLVILDRFSFFGHDEHRKSIFSGWIFILLACTIPYICVYNWYSYAQVLNASTDVGVFTLEMHPAQNLKDIAGTMKYIAWRWLNDYYFIWFFYMLLASIPMLLFYFRKANRLLASITFLLYLGNTIFIILMLPQVRDHDYYILTLIPAVFFHLLLIFDLINKVERPLVRNVFAGLLVVLILFSVHHSKAVQQYRYTSEEWTKDNMAEFFDMEPFMRKLGISRDARVLVINDFSFNKSLYFMNVKGWNKWPIHEPDYIEYPLKHKVKYIVLRDKEFRENKQYDFLFTTKIGEHNGIEVYKVDWDSVSR